MDYEARLRVVREEMKRRDIGMMFLTQGPNLFYLSGVRRRKPELTDMSRYGDYVCGGYLGADSGLTIVAARVQKGFYEAEAKNKPWIDEVVVFNETETPEDVLSKIIKKFDLNSKRVAVDDRSWAKTGLTFQRVMPNLSFTLASEILEPMRIHKDADELALMKKACSITDEVFSEVLKLVKVGTTEYDIVSEIDCQFSKRGVEYPSFMTSASITRPGNPWEGHDPKANVRKLERGDAIGFALGACCGGYCSAFGRNVFVGEPPAEFVRKHDLMMEAEAAAIRALVPGAKAANIDGVARSVIEKAGFGSGFIHRVGHGIGVTAYEPPYLYKPDETMLTPDMMLLVVLSIHMPNSHSCRVEDVVQVGDKGGVALTNFPKRLTVIS